MARDTSCRFHVELTFFAQPKLNFSSARGPRNLAAGAVVDEGKPMRTRPLLPATEVVVRHEMGWQHCLLAYSSKPSDHSWGKPNVACGRCLNNGAVMTRHRQEGEATCSPGPMWVVYGVSDFMSSSELLTGTTLPSQLKAKPDIVNTTLGSERVRTPTSRAR